MGSNQITNENQVPKKDVSIINSLSTDAKGDVSESASAQTDNQGRQNAMPFKNIDAKKKRIENSRVKTLEPEAKDVDDQIV